MKGGGGGGAKRTCPPLSNVVHLIKVKRGANGYKLASKNDLFFTFKIFFNCVVLARKNWDDLCKAFV